MKNALTVSVKILKSKCQGLLGRSSTIIMSVGEDLIWPDKEPVNVVFMGAGLNFLTQKYFWPPNLKFRLWTLSEAHKKLLVELLGLSTEEVGIIPRYKLFPLKIRPVPKTYSISSQCSLVYSGRIIEEKNFDLVVQIANRLQHLHHHKIQFFICGPESKDKTISIAEEEIGRYKWKYPPKISFSTGNGWTRKIKNNPILINLSTSIQEDFGVSVAEAQNAGWPLILSDWGGHRDVIGRNVIKISPKWIQAGKVDKILEEIISDGRFDNSAPKKSSTRKPKILTYSMIEAKLKSVSKNKVASYQAIFANDFSRPVKTSGAYREVFRILSGL